MVIQFHESKIWSEITHLSITSIYSLVLWFPLHVESPHDFSHILPYL